MKNAYIGRVSKPLSGFVILTLTLFQLSVGFFIAPRVAKAVTPTSIFYSSFDPQTFGDWTHSGEKWHESAGDAACADINNKKAWITGTTSTDLYKNRLRKTISTVGYNDITLNWSYRIKEALEMDYVYLQWTSDDSTWTTIKTYSNQGVGSWTPDSFTFSSEADNNPNFGFRFVGSEFGGPGGDKDEFWLDCVELTGIPTEFCGDRIKNGSEECDTQDGIDEHHICTQECTLEYVPYCGDGIVNQETEQCDDNNSINDDSCDNECQNVIPPETCNEQLQDWAELDKSDIGNLDSETYHPITGWSAANIPGGYGECQNGAVCTYRQILGAIEPGQCTESDRDATTILHAGTNIVTSLVIQHLDGISLADSFEVYVNEIKVGEWNDTTPVQSEIWRTTNFDVSSQNLTGDIMVRLHATGAIWGGCPTWGQVAIDWLSFNGCGTPYNPIQPECTTDDDCNDESACTTNTCVQGTCVSADVTCFDQDPCTDDSCEPATGCVFTPNEVCVCDSDKELVSNGSFEEPIVTNPAKWDLFTSVSNWAINWVSSHTETPQLELQRKVNGWLPSDGEQHAELDSIYPTKIYQDIATVPNYIYQVKFAFSPRPSTGTSDNQLEFSWNNVVEEVLSAANTTKNTSWTEHAYEFEATDFTTRLQFADLGTSNALGTFLDKVSVKCVGPVCTENSENWEDFLDKADIGDIGSELSHAVSGWSSVNIPGNYGGCANGATCDYRQVLGEGESCADNESNREAAAVLHVGNNTIKNLAIRHLDGISKGDSFEVYINDEKVGEWNDDSEISHDENWVVSFFDVSAIDISGDAVVKIYAKDDIWGGCSSYGQVSIDWIGISGCGTPYELPKGSITIHKYNDLNGNGEQEEDEPFLPGWEVIITNSKYQYGGLEDPETDSEGKFVFDNLQYGIYDVCEFMQDGWENMNPGFDPFEWSAGLMAVCYEDVVVDGNIDVYFGNKEISQEVECPQGTTAEFLETLTINCGTGAKALSSSLTSGDSYILETNGTCNWRVPESPSGYLGDAEYWLRHDPYGEGWTKMNPGSIAFWDGASPINIDWGEYNDAHEYSVLHTPSTDGQASFYFYDNIYNDNSGSLNMNIYQCKLPMVCEPEETDSCEANATGACANGTKICDEQGQWGECIPADPIDEICSDQQDNDCDGLIDWQDVYCQVCDPEINLVSNGDFETPVVENQALWDIFAGDATNWLTEWMSGVPEQWGQYSRPTTAYLELQRGVAGSARSGEQLAELDSDWGGPDNPVPGNEPASVKIYQNLNTIPGRQYAVSFWFSPRPGRPIDDNILEFSWNDDVFIDNTITGMSGSVVDWIHKEYNLTASSDTTKVQFSDLGIPNSLGTYLDDVSIRCQLNVCGDGFCDGEESCPQDCAEPWSLEISEETASNESETSATITWVTNHPATSRVVYDIVSHPDPLTDPAPNYGYAYSTSETDIDPMVINHSVVIPGLTPGTVYYFRSVSHGSPEVFSSEMSITTTTSRSGGGGSSVASVSGGGGGSGRGLEPIPVSAPEAVAGEVLGESTTLPETGSSNIDIIWCLALIGLIAAGFLLKKEILESIV